ncbi:MAG TPA: tetratricopeptide repeat protein [Herpetosiphonaceae bacterium]
MLAMTTLADHLTTSIECSNEHTYRHRAMCYLVEDLPMEEETSFGAWLKQQRRALDLTQAELATCVGCAIETIKRIEQNVRRPGKQTLIRLLDCLCVPPAERAALNRFARTGQRDPLLPQRGVDHGQLPASSTCLAQIPRPPTALIGRADELAHICRQLQRPDVRLMTLLGPPGVGKTHLALQAAIDLVPYFASSVTFVDLAPISDPILVPSTIKQALQLQGDNRQTSLQQILEALREQQHLLVLDNFEQIIDAAPLIGTLLAHCRRLSILVTSRTALHLRSEWQVPVAPLAVPDMAHLPSITHVARSPAVALFVERVQQRKPDFTLLPENVTTVVGICTHLDGLPLAIELAAAWAPHVSLPALLAQLRSPLALLVDTAHDRPERQQTITRTIAWSYDTLGRGAQRLFARLSIFVGGCTAEAAIAICEDPEDRSIDIRDGLFTLIDKHLVQQSPGPDGHPRISMLTTIRTYAEAILAADASAALIHQRHAAYYLQLAETLEPELKGPHQVSCLDRLEIERANFSTVLTWSLDHAPDMALRLVGSLGRFWLMRGYFDEGRRLLGLVLDRTPHEGTGPRAKALNSAGVLAHAQGDRDSAHALLTESLQVYQSLKDHLGMVTTLNNLAISVTSQEQFQQAYDYSMEALALARSLPDTRHLVHILNTLGTTAEALGDYQRAEYWFCESLTVAQKVGEIQASNIIQNNLATVAFARGEYQNAIQRSKRILPYAHEYGFKHLLAHTLLVLGDSYLFLGKYKWAQQYLSENLLLAKEIGAVEKVVETLHSLGHLAFAAHDYEHMDALYAESLQLAQTLDKLVKIVASLEGLAAAATRRRRHAYAIRLFGAAARQREKVGGLRRSPDHTRYQLYTEQLAAAREHLSHIAFIELWEEGYQLTMEQAVAIALATDSAQGAS